MSDDRKTWNAWWLAEDNMVGQECVARMRSIRSSQSLQRLMRMGWAGAYGGMSVSANSGNPYYSIGAGSFYTRGRNGSVRFNLISTMVDAIASDITNMKMAPRYQTDFAGWTTRRKAKKRTRVIVGQFYDMGVYDLMQRCFFDAAIMGLGIIRGYVDPRTGKPKLERVLPASLIVDENECANGDGTPREYSLYHIIDRGKAKSMFTGHKQQLEDAQGPAGDDFTEFAINVDTKVDQIVLVEAWHLASGPDETDGRHIITTLNGDVVSDEPWDESDALVFYKFKTPQNGFWGVGIAEELEMMQQNVNELIKHVRMIQKLGSNAYIQVSGKSKIRPEALTNAPLTIIRYDGIKPDFQTVAATPPDLWTEIEKCIQQAQMQMGANPQSVQGVVQPQLGSGRAIQMVNATNSKRRSTNISLYERFGIDIAKLLGRLNDDVVSNDPEYTVRASTQRGQREFMENTKWQDVMIPDDDVQVTVQSINSFVHTTAGQEDFTEKFIQQGGIPQGNAMDYTDYPDEGQQVHDANIDKEYVEMQIEEILDMDIENPVPPPEPIEFQNLDVALDRTRFARLDAEINGAPPVILDAIEQFASAIKQLQTMLAPSPVVDPSVPTAVAA